MNRQLLKSIVVSGLLILLGGCGFTLRGSASLPPALHTMQLASLEANSELLGEVQRALNNSGVTITDSAASTTYRLGLGREESSERTLSVNSNARAGEYELTMAVLFQLSQGGTTVLEPQTLTVTRVYLSDPDNAVAKTEEAEIIRQEMRRELAQQILRRLQNLAL